MSRNVLSLICSTLAAAMLSISGAGCEGDRAASSNGELKDAIGAYDSGQFAAAEQHADAVAAANTGTEREKAAYLAGLSEYQQGKLSEAEQHLLLAASSADPRLSGNAKAQLGLIRMRQGRPREAATLFSAASTSLTGEDSRRAAQQAANAYEQAGDQSSARTWYTMAGGSAGGSGSRTAPPSGARTQPSPASSATAPAPRSSMKGFTLQVGAFQKRELADRAAADAQKLADQNSLGQVRVIAGPDERGRNLYMVQVGRFDTPAIAAATRQRIGKLNYIVAPYSNSAVR